MQFPPKHPIKAFVVFFIPIYALLLIAGLAGMDHVYEGMYRSIGNKLFLETGEKGLVQFIEAEDPTTKEMASWVLLINKEENAKAIANGTTVPSARVEISPWSMGYLPIALLLALILSTPIPWKRRLIALAWGLPTLGLFIYFRTWVFIKYFFLNKDEKLDVIDPGPFATSMLEWSYSIFVYNVVVGLFFPILVWILVSFRKEDKTLLKEVMKPFKPRT